MKWCEYQPNPVMSPNGTDIDQILAASSDTRPFPVHCGMFNGKVQIWAL